MNTERIFAVVAARNREFFRDKAGLGWNLLMPLLILVGFAFIFHSPPTTQYRVGLLGPDTGGSAAAAFLEMQHLEFVAQDEEESAIDKVRRHRLDMLLDLRGTPRYWVNSESANGYLVERLLWQSLAGPGDAVERMEVSGEAIRYVDWILPGVLAMNLMFSSLWGVGWVIVRYRKNGVLRRLRATPLTAGEFLVAQVISRLLVVMSMTALVLAGIGVLLDFPMRGSYLALAAVFVAGGIALISIGLLVAARVRSEELANGLLDSVAFPMMILSEVWFSMEGTNVWAQRLSELMPLTHLVDAARRIMLDGAGLADVAGEIALLLGLAAVFLFAAARAFRWQ
jgi:ABC-type multidrug transport system permease subunit